MIQKAFQLSMSGLAFGCPEFLNGTSWMHMDKYNPGIIDF